MWPLSPFLIQRVKIQKHELFFNKHLWSSGQSIWSLSFKFRFLNFKYIVFFQGPEVLQSLCETFLLTPKGVKVLFFECIYCTSSFLPHQSQSCPPDRYYGSCKFLLLSEPIKRKCHYGLLKKKLLLSFFSADIVLPLSCLELQEVDDVWEWQKADETCSNRAASSTAGKQNVRCGTSCLQTGEWEVSWCMWVFYLNKNHLYVSVCVTRTFEQRKVNLIERSSVYFLIESVLNGRQ